MSEHIIEETPRAADESLLHKLAEKVHHESSSVSDTDKPKEVAASVKTKIFRLFGRERPVHHLLGGGKPADIILWRNKKISATTLGVATATWVLFELLEYHLLTLLCHGFIFVLAALFLWANACTFINKSPPRIPDVIINQDLVVNVALALSREINQALHVLRDIALGRDLKKFLVVVSGLWVLSVLGSCCNFLTLFYIVFVLLHTLPVLYEKYEDKIDPLFEKACAELKKQYAILDTKFLSKIPRGPLKEKKQQ